jgi:hypothetical protein
MILNINSDAAVEFTNKMEKLHRSALPVAIRGTLNKAAFDVKQKTMPATSAQEFENRQPNFFKANSRVDMAKGFDVSSMQSAVGFTENGLKGSNNFAVRDLEQQERGGKIEGRSFIPTDVARGGNNSKAVRPVNRMSGVTNIINSNKVKGKNRHQRFLYAATLAGKGGFVIGNFEKKILWRIEDIRKSGGKTVIKKKAIYTYEENREVTVKATGFMERASLMSANKMDDFYIAEATKQIERLRK